MGELPFFYCTLKEQSLELPLKIRVRCQCWRGEGGSLGGEKRGAPVQPCLLCTKRQGHCGAEMRQGMGAEGAASQGRRSQLFKHSCLGR